MGMNYNNLDFKLQESIDTSFIRLIEDEEIIEITEALEKVDNHYFVTDKLEWDYKWKIIKDLVIESTDSFKILLKKFDNKYDIRKFMLKRSEKYNFYCFLEIRNERFEKIHAIIVCDKFDKILGTVMLKE